MIRRDGTLRPVNRRAGVVVLIAAVIFFAAVLQAGLLQNLFKSELELRVILPESGLSGLSVGSGVEVLGTSAGQVAEIVLDPETKFYAVVGIDESMKPFVRQDSKVFIRKQFGIAGAAYLDITRGVGPPLDWDYAVLTAGEETAPTASVGELIEDVREKVLPVVDDTQRAIAAAADLLESLSDPSGSLQTALADLAQVSGKISAGEGNVGRLIVDDSLAREVEAVVAEARATVASFSTVVTNLEAASGDVAGMAASFSTQSEKLPAMIDTTGETLETLNAFVDELSETLPEVTEMVRNSADASDSVPTLLVQTQQTLSELEQLLIQLRSNWLLGGAGDRQRIDRLSPVEARP